ncbi:hypothetical protein K443DRAFT_7528 [Laccaria amethystina LaAM-08-1]|uniref:Uncharacterized protein n=1 Tax=Laccaria amethystina LaAM-08-1 TaxID=1095629 RepID=A0A0C9XS66_9AGAR|nr:hypothetical protein K443DRAFT_7528 [Laccaria amethystina LaAM-08-1]
MTPKIEASNASIGFPISMVSSLPLSLTSRVLEEIRNTLTAQPFDSHAMAEESAWRRKELVEALFSKFLEGEKGKEEGKGTIGSWIKGVKKDLKDAVNEELGRESQWDAHDLGVVTRL